MRVKSYEEVLEETGSLFWQTTGVSMRPLIKEGRDFIYIKKRPEGRLKKNDVALFIRPGVEGKSAYVLHRVLKVNDDGTYWIVGDNCISGEIVKEENVIGVLHTVVRKGKNIKDDNLLYRAYIYLWCRPYPIRFFVIRSRWRARSMASRIAHALHLRG